MPKRGITLTGRSTLDPFDGFFLYVDGRIWWRPWGHWSRILRTVERVTCKRERWQWQMTPRVSPKKMTIGASGGANSPVHARVYRSSAVRCIRRRIKWIGGPVPTKAAHGSEILRNRIGNFAESDRKFCGIGSKILRNRIGNFADSCKNRRRIIEIGVLEIIGYFRVQPKYQLPRASLDSRKCQKNLMRRCRRVFSRNCRLIFKMLRRQLTGGKLNEFWIDLGLVQRKVADSWNHVANIWCDRTLFERHLRYLMDLKLDTEAAGVCDQLWSQFEILNDVMKE